MSAWIAGAEIKGVVFIDSMVPDLQTLLGGVAPGERAFVLDMSAGGLEQIAAILAGNNITDVGSIAIVGHGASGSINVGTTVLNDSDLSEHAAALKTIGAAVAPGGALDLYSCDTAAGAQGRAFIADLAKTASVRVDAATHEIGRTAAGQNWTLDAAAPSTLSSPTQPESSATPLQKTASADVAPASPFTTAAMQSYSGTLTTGTGTSGQLFLFAGIVNGTNTEYIVSTPGLTNSGSFTSPSNGPRAPIGIDTANGLSFSIASTDSTTNYRLVMTDTSGNVVGSSAPIANTDDGDNFGAFAVDPKNHYIYVYSFTGSGSSSPGTEDRQQDQIFRVTYNPTQHTFGPIPYSDVSASESASQGTNNSQSVVNTLSDPSFGAYIGDMEFNEASQQLFYTTFPKDPPYTNAQGFAYPSSNAVYFVNTMTNGQPTSNGKQTQLTSLPNNGSVIDALALDTTNRFVYFTTEAQVDANGNTVGSSGLYAISMDSTTGTATQIAVPANVLYKHGTNYDFDNLSFDPATRSLFVQNSNGAISQLMLNNTGMGLTAISGPTSPVNTLRSLNFNALPTLTTTASGTSAAQNGAAVNLLSNAPTITDPDSGNYLASATVQVTQGGTVRAGDQLLIGGTSFGTSATSYTDSSTGAKFNISYNTGNDTLSIASISNAGTGITTTSAQYASLLSKLQYKDGYTDNTTGTTPTRTFTYHVSDGAIGDPSGVNTTTSTINITRTPPTLAPGGVAVTTLQGATASATAAGPASAPTAGALAGDSDPNGGTLSVAAVQNAGGTQGTLGSALAGTYGSLTLNANGSYSYVANNANAINAVQGSHPVDNYSFTVSSPSGAASEAFKATIDRAPVVTAAAGSVVAGLTATVAAKGALTGDTDADGDTLTVGAVAGSSGNVGAAVAGTYGSLNLKADGSYAYAATNGLAIVTATDGSPIKDTIAFAVTDSNGGNTSTNFVETISLAAGGTETVANAGGASTFSLGATTLTINETSGSTYGGVIQDGTSGNKGGNLVVSGSSSLTLTGASTYTGTTTIVSGAVLALSGNGAIGGSSSLADAGTFDLSSAGLTNTIKGLTGAGSVNLGGNNLTISAASGTFSGTIASVSASGGSLTVSGGTQILSNVDTYTGATTIGTGATLGLSGNGSIAASNTIADAGTFDISAASAGASVKALTGAGGVKLGGNGLTLTSASGTLSGIVSDGGAAGGMGGSLAVSGGMQTLSGANTYTGGTTISGGTLDLAIADMSMNGKIVSGGAGTGAITFAGSMAKPAILALEIAAQPANMTTFGNALASFGANDSIDLRGLTYSGGPLTPLVYTPNALDATMGTISVTENNRTETFALSNPGTTIFYAHQDSAGTGTLIDTVCFAQGTRIRVARTGAIGDVAVEVLAVGDLAVTSSGAHRPIRWLGHRTLDCRNHLHPDRVQPVRILAHAFGESLPARDLVVSPGHAICLDVLGEVLISAEALINGATVTRLDVDKVTYWHVELESHDILLAENLPAESYLDVGNRGFFVESDLVALSPALEGMPDAASRAAHGGFCRPHACGALVEALRRQSLRRAEALGWRKVETGGDLHLVVDGRRIEPTIRGDAAGFALPADAAETWLVSSSGRPCDVEVSSDGRMLGVRLLAIEVGDLVEHREIPLDDPRLDRGFHGLEGQGGAAWRWTSGRAHLPAALWKGLRGPSMLRVVLAGAPLPRWTPPTEPAVALVPVRRLG